MSSATKPVAVVVGATSKWQSDGRNTHLVHGGDIDDSTVPVYARWGVGGAIAQQFAAQGFHVVLTTRRASNAHALQAVIQAAGGDSSIVEMDVSDESSVVNAFAALADAGRVPEVVVYNAGYLEGRDLPADQELLEFVPTEMFDTALHIAARGPFLVAKQVLPVMREQGRGALFFSNNAAALRGRQRKTGQSLYYPRIMMRTLAQVLTEEYSRHGIHIANVTIDGVIDSPGTRLLPMVQNKPELVMNPQKIAETFWYLYEQDPSCWTHEIQITPHVGRVSF